jgi:hypothetical protein
MTSPEYDFGFTLLRPSGYGGASHRVGEVKFVLGSCQGDVEQAAFFFEHVLVVGIEDAAVGEREREIGD